MNGWHGEKGMSLVEVMVTLFMVALLSSCLLGGFTISQRMIKHAEQQTRASSFAYQLLEDLRAQPCHEWQKVITDTEKGSHVFAVNGSEDAGKELQATVRLEKNCDWPGLYDVRVVVTWDDAGMSRSLEMITIFNPALRG